MSGSTRLAVLGVSLVTAAVGVVTGAALHASSGVIDTAAAAPTVAAVTEAVAADEQRLTAADAVISRSVAALGAGSLVGRSVTVVALGDTAAPAAGTVMGDLTAAGALVEPPVVLLDGWIDVSLAPLRSGLAAQLSTTEPRGSVADLDAVLARTLAGNRAAAAPALAALVGAGVVRPTPVPGIDDVPLDSQDPVDVDPASADPAEGGPPVAAAATVVVFVTAGPVPAEAFTAWTGVIATWRSTVPAMDVLVAEYATPAADDVDTVAGSSLVLGIRQGPLESRVSTIDHADTGLGRLSVIRSAARVPFSPVGHYGFIQGASAAVAPVPGVDSAEPGG